MPVNCGNVFPIVIGTTLSSIALFAISLSVISPVWFYMSTPHEGGMKIDAGVDLWWVHGDSMQNHECNEEKCGVVSVDDWCDDPAIQEGTNPEYNTGPAPSVMAPPGVVEQPGGYTKFSGLYCRGPAWTGCTMLHQMSWPADANRCQEACTDDATCTAADLGPGYGCCLHRTASVWPMASWGGACWVKAGIPVPSTIPTQEDYSHRLINIPSLNTFCSKAKAGRGLGILACIVSLPGMIMGCMMCCCSSARVATAHATASAVATLFFVLFMAVFGSAGGDFEECCTARLADRGNAYAPTEWTLGPAVYAGICGTILSAIGLMFSTWGWSRYKPNAGDVPNMPPPVAGTVVGMPVNVAPIEKA